MNVWLVCFGQHVLHASHVLVDTLHASHVLVDTLHASHVLVDTLHGSHVCLAASLACTLSIPKSCVIFLHVTSKHDQFHTKLYGMRKLNVNLSRWCKFN